MKEGKTYSIGTVASMVGIPKCQLRQWCDRYLPHIHWIRIGQFQVHRRFTRQDVELIRRIKEYRRQGFTLATAVKQARQDLDDGKE
jgi:DNA-binding transcriptional MerR regulator